MEDKNESEIARMAKGGVFQITEMVATGADSKKFRHNTNSTQASSGGGSKPATDTGSSGPTAA